MRFSRALRILRSRSAVRREHWRNHLLWSPGVADIRLFYPSGFSEPWRPLLEDVQAEDWLKTLEASDG